MAEQRSTVLARLTGRNYQVLSGEPAVTVNTKIGQGILVTQGGHLPFYNVLRDVERGLFTTRPKEITG